MKTYLISAVLIVAAISCKKNSQNNPVGLSGIYAETSPTANENQLNFINSNQVIITSLQTTNQQNLTSGTFKYQIDNNKIIFTSQSMPQSDATFLIQLLAKDSFSLNPCTCLCPCASYNILVFTKKD